ncbi:CYFIP-related Rac1 interactor B-like isoform X2 [Dunckerocampus dactyliophorus]|uniref:CYFIP-related Rac1 interactor B-like isoform X2 n=1 Tax=Dunckerocampus dactyliophorus TaxID=161453 RepID=UPI0024071DC1|nr:CYFIP-related Rac1 interactor B-like isoform X2 [Dunckerocampus dactyliophorus]
MFPFIDNGAPRGPLPGSQCRHVGSPGPTNTHLSILHRSALSQVINIHNDDFFVAVPATLAGHKPPEQLNWVHKQRMGNLIKVLTRDIDNNGGNFFLDFENAQPSSSEKVVWENVNQVLTESQVILEELQGYTGAGEEIRQAIQSPNEEGVQERAWSAVLPLVTKLKTFYEFSHKLECSLPCLLDVLTSPDAPPTQQLEHKQALARQFALILHFTLRFDELKMTIPAIQNDFSYYRRTISRMRINNMCADADNEVNNELANRMSLFYACATPMLKTLSDATSKFVSDVSAPHDVIMTSFVILISTFCSPALSQGYTIINPDVPIENTTDCLSTMACVCKVMLETPEYRSRFTSDETVLFCLRVMVGVIILYDHVHPAGAFVKTSTIDMKGCIRVLREQPASSVEGLLNALRYTTKHLNDDTTPKQIRNMLQPN